MKLLMISTDRKIFERGSEVALRQVAYSKDFEEVHIIVFANKKFTEISLAPNVWVYPTRSRSRWNYIFDARRLAKFIVKKRGITNITCQDPFETGLVGGLIKDHHPIKLELQIHTDISSPYFKRFTILNRIRTIISKYTLRKADTVRVVSERIKTYVKKYVPESKIFIKPIAVNVQRIKEAIVIVDLHRIYPQFKKIILMASRLEPEKNFPMALHAFKKVLKKMPNAGLVIIGNGSEEGRLKRLAQRLGIGNSVVFLDWQNNLASYYKTCDCFLMTSWYEGYGLTFIEAQAAGAKIVSTDVGVAREVGARIVPFNAKDIARELVMVLS